MHEASLAARSALAAFSAAGIKIALDDYGTGYSSLGHLRDNPVDTLKIDRVFVSGLTRNRGDDAIVVAVITLAHALGMRVVAEGVETSSSGTGCGSSDATSHRGICSRALERRGVRGAAASVGRRRSGPCR